MREDKGGKEIGDLQGTEPCLSLEMLHFDAIDILVKDKRFVAVHS